MKVSRKDLETYQGKLTGDLQNGEKITLKIVKLDELYKQAPDMKVYSSYSDLLLFTYFFNFAVSFFLFSFPH